MLTIILGALWELLSYNNFQIPRAVIDFGSSVIN